MSLPNTPFFDALSEHINEMSEYERKIRASLNAMEKLAGEGVEYAEWVIPFGKYKGQRLRELITSNPAYLFWLVSKIDEREAKGDTLTAFDKGLRIFMKTVPPIDEEMPFGQFKGKRFSELVDEHRYIVYWMDKRVAGDLSGVMARFLTYLEN